MYLSRGLVRYAFRAVRVLLVAFTAVVLLMWLFLPNDHYLRAWGQFNFGTLLQPTLSTADFFKEPLPFPVSLPDDVALVVKTGYGSQARLSGWVDILQDGLEFNNVLFTSDFDVDSWHHQPEFKGKPIVIHNVAKMAMQRVSHFPSQSVARIEKYERMEAALQKKDDELAQRLAKEFGWEMDSIKFIPSLELAWKNFPKAKWFLLVDDDTYLIRHSLQQFLGHFDPDVDLYLGNAQGAWNGRFAHGGSAIVISNSAMKLLFEANPMVVAQLYVESLTTPLGDWHVAAAYRKLGLWLQEGYSRFFNGESPVMSKILGDRICDPIITFHAMKTPELMKDTHAIFNDMKKFPRWLDIWRLLGAPDFDHFEREPFRKDWSHVGTVNSEADGTTGVASAEDCQAICNRRFRRHSCFAWVYDESERVCHTSPWITVGVESKGKTTGINVPLVMSYAKDCIPGGDKSSS